MENSFEFEAHPDRAITLALFKDVSNSEVLLRHLQEGTLDPEFALFNAYYISDVFPILISANKALTSHSRNALKTKTLHSELVYNYAASKNITESLKRCGINANCPYILMAKFDCTREELNKIKRLIVGDEIPLSQLNVNADIQSMKKHFKITDLELEHSTIEDAVVCRIAVRDS